MRKNWLIRTILLVCMLCVPLQALADPADGKDPFYSQGVSKDAPQINSVSEHIDPLSGTLTLSHTDIHLPGNGGLDVNLIRTYNSAIWGRRDIATPGFMALYEKSPVGIGWSMHMGIVRNPFGLGGSNLSSPDNPVVEMPDGSRHILYNDKNVSGRYISKDFWVYKVISDN